MSRCTDRADKETLQLSMCCISRCGPETPVWVKVLLSSGQAQLPSNCQPLRLALCLLPAQQPCEHLCEHSSRMFSIFLPLFTSVPLPHLSPCLPCGDICCCLHGTLALCQTKSLLMATSLVLRTLLHNPSTSVYRPIGALVCKAHKGQVARLSNTAPYFICDTVLAVLSGKLNLMACNVNETPAASQRLHQVASLSFSQRYNIVNRVRVRPRAQTRAEAAQSKQERNLL